MLFSSPLDRFNATADQCIKHASCNIGDIKRQYSKTNIIQSPESALNILTSHKWALEKHVSVHTVLNSKLAHISADHVKNFNTDQKCVHVYGQVSE